MNKHVLPLSTLVVIAILLGVFFTPSGKQTDTSKGAMFSGLEDKANEVEGFVIRNADGVLLDAKRDGVNWVAANYHNYPVAQGKLSKLMEQLLEAQKVEAKTRKAEKYARLGVEALGAEDAQSVQVQVKLKDETAMPVDVLVGNTSANGNYVRNANSEQSWLISQVITLPDSKVDWLMQPILDIAKEQVKSLTLQGENGWVLSKSDPSEDNFQLESMPEGRELKYSTVLNSVVSSLVELKFDALSEIDEGFWQSAQSKQFVIDTFEGAQVTVNMAQNGDDILVRFGSDSGSGSDSSDNDEKEAHWTQWQYQITGFAANQFDKTLEDFLAELPTETSEGKE